MMDINEEISKRKFDRTSENAKNIMAKSLAMSLNNLRDKRKYISKPQSGKKQSVIRSYGPDYSKPHIWDTEYQFQRLTHNSAMNKTIISSHNSIERFKTLSRNSDYDYNPLYKKQLSSSKHNRNYSQMYPSQSVNMMSSGHEDSKMSTTFSKYSKDELYKIMFKQKVEDSIGFYSDGYIEF